MVNFKPLVKAMGRKIKTNTVNPFHLCIEALRSNEYHSLRKQLQNLRRAGPCSGRCDGRQPR